VDKDRRTTITGALAASAAQELARTYRQRLGHFYRQDLHELVPLPLIRGD
jgi:hypothetical protein